MTRRAEALALPLFATDEELGAALLGQARVKEWCALAPALERKGLPRQDALMGGRFVPAVYAWFYKQHGIEKDTGEDWEQWLPKSKSRRA